MSIVILISVLHGYNFFKDMIIFGLLLSTDHVSLVIPFLFFETSFIICFSFISCNFITFMRARFLFFFFLKIIIIFVFISFQDDRKLCNSFSGRRA